MYGAPRISQPQYRQQPDVYDETTLALQRQFSNQSAVKYNAVNQPTGNLIVPEPDINRGWVAPIIDVTSQEYERPVSAPDITYYSKSYKGLIAQAANPPTQSNIVPMRLSAPGINGG